MPEIKTEMVPLADVQEEIKQAKRTAGGRWKNLIAEVLKTKKAAKVTNLTNGQIAAASKACKDTKVSCRTFYGKGKVILYMPEK
jgi:hypothetical protein